MKEAKYMYVDRAPRSFSFVIPREGVERKKDDFDVIELKSPELK